MKINYLEQIKTLEEKVVELEKQNENLQGSLKTFAFNHGFLVNKLDRIQEIMNEVQNGN